MLMQLDACLEDRPTPTVGEFTLPAPRISPPSTLAAQFSAAPLDRLNHSAGKSYADCARMWLREPPTPPDWVAFPDDEQAVIDILDWAQANNVAVIPYGGGSSVSGGVEAAVGDSYAGVVSLDLERLNGVLEVDRVSRAARIQAGALGPELEAQLKPHRLTLRHFPQSFEFSTLGGWIVPAHSHYATADPHRRLCRGHAYGHTCGVMQTGACPVRRGPPDRLVLGSEGPRVLPKPGCLQSATLPCLGVRSFSAKYDAAAGAARIGAVGPYPNCACSTLFGNGACRRRRWQHGDLVLGFESADHHCRPGYAGAEPVSDPAQQTPTPSRSWPDKTPRARSGAAGAVAQRLQQPYWRDRRSARCHGYFRARHLSASPASAASADLARAIKKANGKFRSLPVDAPHPTAPPYFTIATRAADGSVVTHWQRGATSSGDKRRLSPGGTITHHHAVGPITAIERGRPFL
jgi:alkyldihydroxyacetonephosphate synthase